MGRRRRGRKRRIYRPKKKIPKIFPCPQCGKKYVSVNVDKKNKIVVIKCGSCQLEASFPYDESLQIIDYYSKFVDRFYETSVAPTLVSTSSQSIRESISEVPKEESS